MINDNLEEIIKENIKKNHNKLFIAYAGSSKMILGYDEPPEGMSEYEKIKYIMMNNKSQMYFIDKEICLTVDKSWNSNELKDFIYKTIKNNKIIEAINNKDIFLKIDSVQGIETFTKEELYFKNLRFLKTLERLLKNINIKEYDISNIE